MKLKRNKLFLLISSLGVVTSSCLIITSCSKVTNPFDSYDANTSIRLDSRKKASQLYEVAKSKIPNIPHREFDNHSNAKDYVNNIWHEHAKEILYWEIAFNLAEKGKTWKFKNKDQSTFLWFTISSNIEWFSNDYKVSGVTFDYFIGGNRFTFKEDGKTFSLDYGTSWPGWWCFFADTNSLFQSWMCQDLPTP